MDKKQEEFFEKVRRTLRMADQANEREPQEEAQATGETSKPKPSSEIKYAISVVIVNIVKVIELRGLKQFSEIPFAIGMGILAVVTGIISLGSSTFDNKLMFGSFGAICLLICVYKLDRVTHLLREKPGQLDHSMKFGK